MEGTGGVEVSLPCLEAESVTMGTRQKASLFLAHQVISLGTHKRIIQAT